MSHPRAAAWTGALLLALGLALAGCSARQAAERREDRVQAFLNAGNQAFRTGDYALAARRYAAAAALDPEEPACYVGLGMALSKLNRGEEARAAHAKARALAARRDSLRAAAGR
jgi:Flp pilus assembly protein TadD